MPDAKEHVPSEVGSPQMSSGPVWATPAKGAAMGLADSVPGISGGTIALVLGIHPRLVGAIASLDGGVVRDVLRGRIAQAWRHVDATFLTFLAIGIAAGLLAGATAVERLIEDHPMALMGFLLGLMAASARAPARVPAWRLPDWAALCTMALLAAVVAMVPALAAPQSTWFLPVAGAIAACAMILPGISGSALLVLMGLYEPVIEAVADIDVLVIALVGAGAVVGLLLFSKGLRSLLERHEGTTHAAMVGLLIGSLVLLWPWRNAPGFADGLPAAPDSALPLLWIALGAVVGFGLEWMGRAPSTQKE